MAKQNKNARKAIEEATGKNVTYKGDNTGKGGKLLVEGVIAKAAISTFRTDRMEKKLKKMDEQYRHDAEQAQGHTVNNQQTFGDNFAAAFEKAMLKQSAQRMKKLQAKVQKRRGREQMFTSMLDGTMGAVGQAARTTGMQGSMGSITASQAGIIRDDLPYMTNGYPSNDNDEPQMQ